MGYQSGKELRALGKKENVIKKEWTKKTATRQQTRVKVELVFSKTGGL